MNKHDSANRHCALCIYMFIAFWYLQYSIRPTAPLVVIPYDITHRQHP